MLKLFLLGGFRGIAANVLWTRAEELQARPRLGPPEGHRRPDHQAPAPLPLDLDLPGLEPRLQRLGRVGRPRGQVRLDQEGDQVPPGRRREEPEVARPDLGHRLDLLPQARLLRRVDHPPPALPRRRGRGLQDLPRPRDGHQRRQQRQLPARLRLVQPRGRPGRRGGQPAHRGHGEDIQPIEYVDPTPQRKGRPDDLAFRSMPAHAQTRYAAGLEKMSIAGHRGHLRRGRQERVGPGPQRVGQVRRARLRVATT